MAERTATRSSLGVGIEKILWEGLTESDTCEEILFAGLGPIAMNIQVIGTFGGAAIVLQGSNDGTNWVTVKDVAGNDVSLTAAGAFEVSSSMAYFRPSASGGSSQDLDIHMVVRGC